MYRLFACFRRFFKLPKPFPAYFALPLFKHLKKLLLLYSLLFLGVLSCIEPFELDYRFNKRILIVDAILTDNETKAQQIIIREAVPNKSSVTFLPIKGAKVEVIKNGEERYLFQDLSNGIYAMPSQLKLVEKIPYVLEILLADGSKYVSEPESFIASFPISEVRQQLVEDGIELGSQAGYAPAQYIYLDTEDKPGKGNNYVWDWKLYERQFVCQSCTNGRYFIDRRTGVGACRDESEPFQTETFYNDYLCQTPCWEVFYNETVNALSDTYIDGQPIKSRLVAQLPIYQAIGALLEVSQKSVSAGAFRYLKLLIEQSQNVGSLADTPPAPLISNVKNVADPNEAVGGYFSVASESIAYVWLDRNEIRDQRIPVRGLLGRSFSPEISETPDRPPLAPCLTSRNRTPIRPTEWQGN